MPRFFLNLYNAVGFVPDEEGIVVDSVDKARDVALVSIRSLICEDVSEGRVDLRGRIEVMDGSGTCVDVIPFNRAVTLYLDEPAT